MKLRTFKYLTVEGFKNVWVNRMMSLASIGVLVACMLIMGVAIAFSKNVDYALGTIEENNVARVYYDEALSEEDARAINAKIAEMDNVKSVRFIPKSEGLQTVIDDMDDQYSSLFEFIEDENPLPDATEVKFEDLEKFNETVTALEKIDGVNSVGSQRELAEQLTSIRHTVTVAGAWIIVLLVVIALVIVCNTIRITMYSRKLEISIMKAVGATNGFIRFPFLIEGMVLGVLAAGFSTALTYAVYRLILNMAVGKLSGISFTLLPFRSFALPLIGIFMFIGIVIGLVGSTIIITKYLNKEGSEFRAL